ncbi:TetR family transcriptional regulator [Pseudoalteromonas sp. NBT06-2]|uniref:TetR/AcrR family transcriptional regulator n=1 Tax=Pseudoalteromonas sp. NBT06-2 TaxID=2025950 RepID=UPI00148246E2|nr:TetR family transcriptional regulator [Pseudoalteromonas sp. NBT06-2]
MGRPSNKAQRRAEIVNALQSVIARVGYEGASIQAISKEAGIASGLVHYHFQNKQEILVELVHSLTETSVTRYEELKKNASNAQEKIEAFIDAALALGDGSNEQAVAAWVVIGAESIRQEEVRELYKFTIARQLEELRNLLQNYAHEKKKNLSANSIEHISTMVISAIEGAYQLAATASKITPRNYAATTLKGMVFSVLDK